MIAEEYVVVLLLAILLLQNGEACNIRYCEVSQWSAWSGCFHRCGSAGTEYRTRYKTVVESCGGDCHYDLMEHRDCPKTCLNGGTPSYWGCACRTGYTGSCCELDQNECQMNRYYCIPGGTCVNTHGSYRCFCYQGYVSSHGGTACIADKRDGKANPSTQKSSTKAVEISCGVGLGGPALMTILWMVRRYYRKRNNRQVGQGQHAENNPHVVIQNIERRPCIIQVFPQTATEGRIHNAKSTKPGGGYGLQRFPGYATPGTNPAFATLGFPPPPYEDLPPVYN